MLLRGHGGARHARFAERRARQVELLAVAGDDLRQVGQRLDLVADHAAHRLGALAGLLGQFEHAALQLLARRVEFALQLLHGVAHLARRLAEAARGLADRLAHLVDQRLVRLAHGLGRLAAFARWRRGSCSRDCPSRPWSPSPVFSVSMRLTAVARSSALFSVSVMMRVNDDISPSSSSLRAFRPAVRASSAGRRSSTVDSICLLTSDRLCEAEVSEWVCSSKRFTTPLTLSRISRDTSRRRVTWSPSSPAESWVVSTAWPMAVENSPERSARPFSILARFSTVDANSPLRVSVAPARRSAMSAISRLEPLVGGGEAGGDAVAGLDERARGFLAAPDDGLDDGGAALVERPDQRVGTAVEQGGQLVDLALQLLVGGGEAGGEPVAGLDEHVRGFLAAADDRLDDAGAALVEGVDERLGAAVDQVGEVLDLALQPVVVGGQAGGDAVARLDEDARSFLAASDECLRGFLAPPDEHVDHVGAALVERIDERVGAPVEQGGEFAGAGAEHVVEVARALFERVGDGVGARPEHALDLVDRAAEHGRRLGRPRRAARASPRPNSLTRRWVTSSIGLAHRGGDVLALGGERVGGGVGALASSGRPGPRPAG